MKFLNWIWILAGIFCFQAFYGCGASRNSEWTAEDAYNNAAKFARNQILHPVESKGSSNIVSAGNGCHLPTSIHSLPFSYYKDRNEQKVFPFPVDEGCTVFVDFFGTDVDGQKRYILEAQVSQEYNPDTKTWKEHLVGARLKMNVPGCVG